MACGTKSGQILLNRVTDASILNIYITYRLKLIENEAKCHFLSNLNQRKKVKIAYKSPKMVENALLRVSINLLASGAFAQ